MHFNTILPLACILATLAAAAPSLSSPVNSLAPHTLPPREPANGVHILDSGKRDASAEPARKGHFGGPDGSKRDASPGFVAREGLIVGNHEREALPEPIGKGHLGGPGSDK